jgi:hypothetical protein
MGCIRAARISYENSPYEKMVAASQAKNRKYKKDLKIKVKEDYE